MDTAILCAANKLLQSGTAIEAELERTLSKCDSIGHHLTYVVSETLTKLVQDVAGAPLVLASYVSNPHAMLCLITVLHMCLTKVQPENLLSTHQIAAGKAKIQKLCEKHNLPTLCGEVFGTLIAEISQVFRDLDIILAPPFVEKKTNSKVLHRRVRHFFRAVRSELLVYAFNSLKLSVCMQAMSKGCLRVSRQIKGKIYATLRQVKRQARVMAAVNEPHSENVLAATIMSRPRNVKKPHRATEQA